MYIPSAQYWSNTLTSGPIPQVASSAAHIYVRASKLCYVKCMLVWVQVFGIDSVVNPKNNTERDYINALLVSKKVLHVIFSQFRTLYVDSAYHDGKYNGIENLKCQNKRYNYVDGAAQYIGKQPRTYSLDHTLPCSP